MYLPLDVNVNYTRETDRNPNLWSGFAYDVPPNNPEDITVTSKNVDKTIIDENILQNLLSDKILLNLEENAGVISNTYHPFDLIQSENDFIDAYNALAKVNPLPNINQLEYNSDKRKNNVSLTQEDTKNGSRSYEKLQINKRSGVQESQPKNVENTSLQKTVTLKTLKLSKETEINTNSQKLVNNIINTDDRKQNSNTVSNIELPSESINTTTHQHSKKQKTSIENVYNGKTDEKTKNLNDIVDNTQKLIQQMKEEINLDINSLDGRNTSNSEHESSSNDEQESSFSGTESGTDNITSDENETSSTENEKIQKSKTNSVLTQITSSEDNEQFEEALDNFDSQIDDFKHANMELLDTIARNLQEDHILEVKELDTFDLEKQDSNNNLYTVVNSFEEIYEELSSTNSKEQQNVLNTNHVIISNVLPHKHLLAKQTASVSTLKFLAPTKLIISENKQPIFKAKLGIEENNLVNIDQDEHHQVTEEETKITNEKSLQQTIEQTKGNEKSENSGLNVLAETSNTVSAENYTETPNLIDELIYDKSAETITTQKDHAEKQNSNDNTNINNTSNNNEQKEDLNVEQNKFSIEKLNTVNETNTTTDSNNKTVPTKSNIPKLIKITHPNKGKVEKYTPKLIVSKVPIRRASIKQYPAPAPPKPHFGNIQIGNVKQLQTRLLNGKSKDNTITFEATEAKPSTSTLPKKKPAPPPPIKSLQETKQMVLTNTSPPKETKHYFRETCRTEDEWTESDSENSQVETLKSTQEQQERPLSPPPPITLRRVSGQLIDLAKVRLPEGSPEVNF